MYELPTFPILRILMVEHLSAVKPVIGHEAVMSLPYVEAV